MKVIVGKYAGFCGGVKLAIQKTEEATDNNVNIYCLGEVVHNKQVIESLEAKGLNIVNSINEVPNNSKMIIRAHGEAEEIYKIAEDRNIEIIDTTCGNVKVIHNKIKKASKDSFIIIIGEKNHPEVIGHIGFAGKNSFVVQDEEDILDAYMEYEKTNLGKVYVVSQTTFSSKKFDDLEKEIYTNFVEADVIIDKTICNSTEIRQEECRKIAKEVECMIVIGGKNSANTKKLVEISEENCKRVYWIQILDDIKEENFDGIKKIGIMAGASTPSYIIDEVKEFLENK